MMDAFSQKLLKQGYVAPRLKSSAQQFYGRHQHLVDHFEIYIHISNDDGSFTFYVDLFFPLSLSRFYQTLLYI